jgi:hypothetical protein
MIQFVKHSSQLGLVQKVLHCNRDIFMISRSPINPKDVFLTVLACVIFSFSTLSQVNYETAALVGSSLIGKKEVSYLVSEKNGCRYKTSAHDKGLFQAVEILNLKPTLQADKFEILNIASENRVFAFVQVNTCNRKLDSDISNEDFKSPLSPFNYCKDDNNPIGGGKNYDNTISEHDADIVISVPVTTPVFKDIIESAPPFSVIYIAGSLIIDLSDIYQTTGSHSIMVPENITIASGRGSSNGSAIIRTQTFNLNSQSASGATLFLCNGDGIRFTGLTLSGPFVGIGSEDQNLARIKSCIGTIGFENLEVDNCEILGWPYAAIIVGKGYNNPSFNKNRIHHNYFHHNRQTHFGYGVMISYGYAYIHSNVFKSNRHDISGSGRRDIGYEASCNTIQEGGASFNFDMHAEGNDDNTSNAGRFIWIHHNDFKDMGSNRLFSSHNFSIGIRGRPDVQCRIENNRFGYQGPESAIKQITQFNPEGYGNMLVWNNIYASNEYRGWYVKSNWLKTRASNFMNLKSTNDGIMTGSIYTGNVLFNFTFGDYDGDGKTDVFKFENGKLFRIPLDAGIYGLNSDWELCLNSSYDFYNFRFGFFNSDNRTDLLVVPNFSNSVMVAWGSNTQWSHFAYTPEIIPMAYSLGIGDFDGNGIDDLFFANGVDWKVRYNSNGAWQTINTSSYGAASLNLGWFNSNNQTDVFLADGISFKTSFEGVSSWNSLASSSFLTNQLRVYDFDGDNISDIIDISNTSLYKVSLEGNTPWTSCTTNIFDLGSFPYGNF